MKIAIDMDHLVILAKMNDHLSTLSKLMDIEYPHVAQKIIYCDQPVDFKSLTDYELKKLIKSAGGPEVTNIFCRDTLLRCVHAVVAELPEREAKAFEVDVQHRSIADDDQRAYEYVPGSTLPRAQDKLPDVQPLKRTGGPMAVPASAAIATSVAAQATALAARPAVLFNPALAASITATGQQVLREVKADLDFSSPKTGTSTHRIFSFCDQEWKAGANKADKATLANIRKRAVDVLCAEGLNISTVRTQAIRWEQNRERFA